MPSLLSLALIAALTAPTQQICPEDAKAANALVSRLLMPKSSEISLPDGRSFAIFEGGGPEVLGGVPQIYGAMRVKRQIGGLTFSVRSAGTADLQAMLRPALPASGTLTCAKANECEWTPAAPPPRGQIHSITVSQGSELLNVACFYLPKAEVAGE